VQRDSSSAFKIQDTTGATIFNVNTLSSSVEVTGSGSTSGLRFTNLNSTSSGGTSFTGILGLDTQGNVGLSQASVSLTSPALAYWDGANNPTTGSQAYPTPTMTGSGTGTSSASCGTGSWSPQFVSGSGVELTAACGTQSGSINWSFSQVAYEETQFQFKAGGGNGADSTWFYSYADGVPTTEYGNLSGTAYSKGYLIYFSEFHHCVGITYAAYADGNQCNNGGGTSNAGISPLASTRVWNLGDNAFHDVDIQLRGNVIVIRWDGNVVLTETDVYTRDLSNLDFGFGSRTGGSNNEHYIKGLLVTKLGTDTSRYNIDTISPMGGNMYMDNTAGAQKLGIGSAAPDSTLEVDGTESHKTLATSGAGVAAGNWILEGSGTGFGTTTSCTTTGSSGTNYTANANVVGTGTSFTSQMVGDQIVLPDGTIDTIATFTDSTHITTTSTHLECPGGYTVLAPAFSVTGTATPKIQIGSGTTDTTQVNLQLDSYSTYADSGTCNTTTNQGAMYYNTNTAAVRGCINGSWEDVVTTSGLGILTYGIVPDSGTSPGNLGGISATDASDGPCKVYMGSVANSVRWNGCTVYTQGRKQTIAAQSTDFTTGITTTGSAFQNLCIFTAGSAPSFGTASTTQTSATVPAFTPGAPAVCLATIKEIAGGSGIGAIYGTRVFTTSTKTFAAVATAVSPGFAVKLNGSPEQATPTAATTDPFLGVVAAWSGTTQTTAINAVIVIGGPTFVKATAGTAGQYINPTATTGMVSTTALITTAPAAPDIKYIPYTFLGLSQSTYNAPGTQCSVTANADTCRGSLLVDINIR
jgi:hypothetical protein